MTTRYVEDKADLRRSRTVAVLRFVFLVLVWILVAMAAFAAWLATAM